MTNGYAIGAKSFKVWAANPGNNEAAVFHLSSLTPIAFKLACASANIFGAAVRADIPAKLLYNLFLVLRDKLGVEATKVDTGKLIVKKGIFIINFD